MPNLAALTPLELADLLQAAYADDRELPGEHLTDPVARYDLAHLIDRDATLRLAVIADWLKNREALKDDFMYWLDAEFLDVLGSAEPEED
ncbi:hypothetical protein MF271_21920 (plasmid) [Deinococcus sp. KNUC1210]|uniref:hypothetical protein n=1 Tax=Deinococcus sp. KNUC1210 TaxID=2917691 RepID=UPI001EEFA14B|nr:hypothetical protein [Deinococcus sp. KNUC1210]ULH18137.1 hypothetical protein MF271_21920 [Deinococcus sp. KNUC1210]